MIRINKNKLNELKTIIEKMEELNTIMSEYAPYITRARELGVIEESHPMIETHDWGASQHANETQIARASHIVNEPHIVSASHKTDEHHSKSASHLGGETHCSNASHMSLETQIGNALPYTTLRPKTNPRAEIRVFNEDDKTRLEWWIAGRKTEETTIPDAWDTFYAMQSMVDWNTGILTFSKFWKNVKRINGMSTNKASLIFNFIGVDPRFDCEMKKTTKTMPTGIEITDWAIIFNTESKPKFTVEQMRRYWNDLLG